jgi:hypothetical protein
MHPIERLRYVARAEGADARSLVRETAGALGGLGLDPAGLVVACRRIVERHPGCGPLWWLCANVLADPAVFEPRANPAIRWADEIVDDPTPRHLVDELPDGARVLVVGWPDLAGDALARRGDLEVVVVDVRGEGGALARALLRYDDEAHVEVVSPEAVGAAVRTCDIVLVEAHAAGSDAVVATCGSFAAAAVAATLPRVATWLVIGRGRMLPRSLWGELVRRTVTVDPLGAGVEVVDLVLADRLIGADADPLHPGCPEAHELLRTSAM